MNDGMSVQLAAELRPKRLPFKAVPIIEFRDFLTGADRENVVRDMATACRDVGFFYLHGHGLADELLQAAFAQTRAFFALPEAEKLDLHIRHSPIHRGYFPLFEENTDPTLTADLKEGFDMARDLAADSPEVLSGLPLHGPNVWPKRRDLPDFRPTMERYFAALCELARSLLRCIALGLALPETWFDDKIDRPLAQLRLLHYPPQTGHVSSRTLGCGAHSDYGCLTLLAQDENGGLQLQNTAGEWVDAVPIPGTFVVNIGDQMARWTNDHYPATRHRVINTTGRERYSMPFFFDPNYEARVACLPSCLAPGERPRHTPVVAGEYLLSRYNDTFAYRQGADPVE